jgi:LysM repeat protein
MSNGVQGAGGPSAVYAGGSYAEAESTKVGPNEKTLKQVSDRTGYGEEELQRYNPNINPNKLQKDQVIKFPPKTTIVKEGQTFDQIAKEFHTTPEALRKANPNVNPDKIQPGMELNNPEYYQDKNATVHSNNSKPAPKKSGKEEFPVKVNEKGVSVKLPKGAGDVRFSPGGNVTYNPPKIGDVQPSITKNKVTPGIKSAPGDPIPNPAAATRKQDDYKKLDPKTEKKLDNEKNQPGREITDKEIKKGFDEVNGTNIDREFEARKAYERLKNPLPKKSLQMP